MRVRAQVASSGYLRKPERGQKELNNLQICSHSRFFPLCLTKCKTKTYKQRQNKRTTERQEQKKDASLILQRCTGSVNCAPADRVASKVDLEHCTDDLRAQVK